MHGRGRHRSEPVALSSPLEAARKGFSQLDFDSLIKARALEALEPWLTEERFAAYRPQLESLIDRGEFEVLFDAFWQVIPFGTGGRRGAVGIGTNRFNSWTLLTSVQGHADTLKEAYPGEDVVVVVAFDVRLYLDLRGVYDAALPNPLIDMSSADFAAEAAGVYAANGIRVLILDPRGGDYMSTPELSLAIRNNKAHGGLNVSASHNHPDDNGGKFYNRHGGQDVPPDDEMLARRVEDILDVHSLSFEDGLRTGMIELIGPAENAHYLQVNARLSLAPDQRGGCIVFTPLHGTGASTVGRLLRAEGFDVRAVPSQEAFDGRFPAVKFLAPNPEVPACYEEAEKIGDECHADMILATDPDADRIGLEARRKDGSWQFVSGDEIIFLVTRFVLGRRRELGLLPENAFMLKTLVTSSLATTIARSYGCKVVPDLLVGFKYMAKVLASLEETGSWRDIQAKPESFVLGVEESHGLLLSSVVRDKDAAGAALVLAELNATLVAEGRTLLDELDSLYARFGYMANKLLTTVMTGASGLDRIRAIQGSLRADPPQEILGRKVLSFEDLADESGWLGPIKSGTDASSRNVLVLSLENDARLIIRPSGTEPKNKIYVEVPGITPKADLSASELDVERKRCDAEADELGRAFERLMLARVGIELTESASRVSNLLGLDLKVHFGTVFVPGLEAALQGTGVDLEAFVDESLESYGTDPRDLVAGGVAHWLTHAELAANDVARVRGLFGLGDAQSV
jgi:phosphoglucomutase/phosphomannomutase